MLERKALEKEARIKTLALIVEQPALGTIAQDALETRRTELKELNGRRRTERSGFDTISIRKANVIAEEI